MKRLLILAIGLAAVPAGAEDGGGAARSAAAAPHISAIAEAAADAFEMALAEKNGNVMADAAAIFTAWRQFREMAVKDGLDDATLTKMDAAVEEFRLAPAMLRTRVQLAQLANAVTAPLAEAAAFYSQPVTAQIISLKHLGRRIVLDGLAGDPSSASKHCTEMNKVREQFMPAAQKSGDAAARFAKSLAAIDQAAAARDSSALTKEAYICLELIEEIEQALSK